VAGIAYVISPFGRGIGYTSWWLCFSVSVSVSVSVVSPTLSYTRPLSSVFGTLFDNNQNRNSCPAA
jgi:hypothetical protein